MTQPPAEVIWHRTIEGVLSAEMTTWLEERAQGPLRLYNVQVSGVQSKDIPYAWMHEKGYDEYALRRVALSYMTGFLHGLGLPDRVKELRA